MSSLISVPFFPDEMLPSFLSRIARANGRSTLRAFLKDLGLTPRLIAQGNEEELCRLADIICHSPNDLISRRLVNRSHVTAEYRGVVHSRAGGFRVCPDCIRDDRADITRMPGTRRYGRTAWVFGCISTCGLHGRRLVKLPEVFHGGFPDFYEALDKAGDDFAAQGATGHVTITDLEIYYGNRADGGKSAGGLADLLSLPNAARLSEWMGVGAIYGREPSMVRLGEEELRQARDAGFQALRDGEDAVYQLLDRISTPRPVGIVAGGNGFYGRLYRKLQSAEPASEFQWFRELLRKHATATERIPNRAKLFGAIGGGAWTTIKAIADEVGLHSQTVQRYLTEHFGYEPTGSHEGLVSKDSAEGLLSALRGTIDLPGVSELLGWSEYDCRLLASIGIFVPVATIRGPEGTERHRYNPEAVSNVMSHLRGLASSQTEGLVRFTYLKGVDRDNLLKAAFNGRLGQLGYRKGKSLLDSLFVSLQEVAASFPKSEGILAKVVRERLALDPKALTALLAKGLLEMAPSGTPGFFLITDASVERFESTYVTVGFLRRQSGLHHSILRSRMQFLGIKPAFTTDETRAVIIRREDANRLMDAEITEVMWRRRAIRSGTR